MNKKMTTTLVILSSLLLSACVLRPQTPEQMLDSIAEDEAPASPVTNEDSLSQPTISESTELDVLQKELDAIDILEEDFSDIN